MGVGGGLWRHWHSPHGRVLSEAGVVPLAVVDCGHRGLCATPSPLKYAHAYVRTVSRESESLVDLMCKVRPRTLTTSRALRLAAESAVQRKRFEVAGAHNSHLVVLALVTLTVFVFEFSS